MGTPTDKVAVDKEVDRLAALLDVAVAQFRKGDTDATLMALEEALKSAESLPQKKEPKS